MSEAFDRRLLAFLGWLVALLTLSLLVVALSGTRFLRAVAWPSDLYAFENTDYGPIDVALVGSSRISFGLAPTAIDPCLGRALGRPTTTVSLARVFASAVTESIVARQTLSGDHQPRVLVLEMAPETVNAAHFDYAENMAENARIEDIPLCLSDARDPVEAAACLRSLTRGVETLAQLAGGTTRQDHLQWMMLYNRGGQYCFGNRACEVHNQRYDQDLLRRWEARMLRVIPKVREERYSEVRLGEGSIHRAMEAVADWAADRGVALALLNMPVHQIYQDQVPAEVYADYLAWLNEFTVEHGAALYDANVPAWRARRDLYHDPDHLNATGALALSQDVCRGLLSPLLQRAGGGRSVLFNSLLYAVFLVIALVVCRLLERWRGARNAWLLLCSYFFYASWDARYLILIVVSTALDYGVGVGLSRTDAPGRRKALLLTSIVGNLGLLGVFKYGNFALENVEALFSLLGVGVELPRVPGKLPVGISFYTFQTLSYSLDLYRKKIKPARNLYEFALFVSFFPQLVAGPIVRASELLPQLEERPRQDVGALGRGVGLILIGLVKKMVIADSIGLALSSPFFSDPGAFSAVQTLFSIWAFYFQIYCDFSGYTDIALGSALLFGYTLPENFDRPALARSPLAHWQRWHMTLQNFLRDYVYIPLGGNRHGPARGLFNIAMVFVLGGIWHGVGWTYALMGLYNGLLAVGWRLLHPKEAKSWLGGAAERLLTFHLTATSMVFLQPYPVSQAWAALANLLDWSAPAASLQDPRGWVWAGVAAALHLTPRGWKGRILDTFEVLPPFSLAVAVLAVCGLCSLFMSNAAEFYYFQF